MSPLPSAPDLDGVYEEEYFRAYRNHQIALPAEAELPPARYRARLLDVQRQRGVGHLLEIGPGHGAFLNYARQCGWLVIGLEASRYAAERARARYGIEVRCATLETTDLPDGTFDVVHLSHVLEHLRDPIGALRAVHRLLKPGGAVIVEVPNEFESLQFRLLNFFGLARSYAVKSTHLFFFTPATLQLALRTAGFLVQRLRTVRDLTGGSLMRQLARRIVALCEQPVRMAPLIEAIAVKKP